MYIPFQKLKTEIHKNTGKYRIKPIEKKCIVCHKTFNNLRKKKQKISYNWTISPKQFEKVKCCSVKCQRVYLKTILVGERCGGWKGGIVIKDRKAYYHFKRLERIVRQKGNGGHHTLDQWNELKKKYNYMCLCCKKYEPEIKLSQDHIIPISKGGSDNIDNIQPLCKSCNCIKNVKTISYIQLYETSTI